MFIQLMDKRLFLFYCALFAALMCSAQSLENFNTDRLSLNQQGMIVLGSWAVANLVSSPILASRAEGSNRYFHQMNGYWNTVNLILAGAGFYSAMTTDAAGLTLLETIHAQQSMEKILLFNTGLDVAYMIGGLYLQERSKSAGKNKDRLKGFGRSLVLQGAFLFVFDLGFYVIQTRHGLGLGKFVDQLAVSPTGFQLTTYF